MKTGKAVYKSGPITATVQEGVVTDGVYIYLDTDDGTQGAALLFEDFRHLREIVRQLRVYEVAKR